MDTMGGLADISVNISIYYTGGKHSGRTCTLTTAPLTFSAEDPIFSGDFLDKANLIFDNAEKVADNEDVLRRVEMASIPILYLKCKLNPVDARNNGTYKKFRKIADGKTSRIMPNGVKNQVVDQFITVLRMQNNLTNLS